MKQVHTYIEREEEGERERIKQNEIKTEYSRTIGQYYMFNIPVTEILEKSRENEQKGNLKK